MDFNIKEKRKRIEEKYPFLKDRFVMIDGIPGYVDDCKMSNWIDSHKNTKAHLNHICGSTMMMVARDKIVYHFVDIYNFIQELEKSDVIESYK